MADAFSDFMEDECVTGIFRSTDIAARSTLDNQAVLLGAKCYADEANGDGNVYLCTTAGTAAASPPAFNTTFGATTTDGGVTWTACQPGVLKVPLEVALFDTSASLVNLEAGTLTGEISGNGYARTAINPGDANWTASVNGLTDNVSDVVFPTASGGNWGTVRFMAIMDAANNVLVYGQLTQDKIVNDGDTFKFNAGDLNVTIA